MAYRDHAPACPRCRIALHRRPRRDIWRCPRCAGTQLATSEVERRLRLVLPEAPVELVRELRAARRGRASALPCPTCLRPMEPLVMADTPVARCGAHDQLWIDAPGLDRIAARVEARYRSQRSWLARLLAHLFAS